MADPLTEGEREAVRMMMARIRHILQPTTLSVTVFGSRARGEGGPESDVDLLVVLDRDDFSVRRVVFDLAYEVYLATDVLLSPLVVSPAALTAIRRSNRQLIQDIERDGVLVG
jgi:predicted nucleotidyltransferase